MKKILLVLFGAFNLLGSYAVNAQATFTTDKDTVFATVYGNNATFHNDITNTSSQAINIRWTVGNNDFPTTWLSNTGICDAELCQTDLTVPHSTVGAPYKVDTANLFDIQLSGFNSAPSGTHFMVVNIKDITNTPSYNKDIVFVINKFPTNVPKTTRPDENITLYPNPAKNELNVLFNADADVKIISIYNLIGKAVNVYRLTSNNSAKLDIENMPSGVYFLRMIDSKGQVIATRKFTHQ